jgi:phage gpG-like protein
MSASLKIDTKGLKRLIAKFEDPSLKEQLQSIAQEKAIAALVGQAIAENFAMEGPGWAPLKAKTIRASVAKKLRKSISSVSDEDLEKYEELVRQPLENLNHEEKHLVIQVAAKVQTKAQIKKGAALAPTRKILRKTGLLMKTATIPGYKGSEAKISGSNVYRVEGNNLVWGTDLVYAKTHNEGDEKRNIPKRKFLVINEKWMKEINEFVANKVLKIIRASLGTTSK